MDGSSRELCEEILIKIKEFRKDTIFNKTFFRK